MEETEGRDRRPNIVNCCMFHPSIKNYFSSFKTNFTRVEYVCSRITKNTENGENNTMFRENFLLFASFAKTITFAKHKDREN
jgi:hypothetical protein